MATQGEKITEIGTKVEFIAESVKEMKDTLVKITDNQQMYATKKELKELSSQKAGIWTESWVRYVAFATGAVILMDIIQKFILK